MSDDVVEIQDGPVLWSFDRRFLSSTWTCLWGRGCKGILDHDSTVLEQGCCSVGAELDGAEEANLVDAGASALTPAGFQYHAQAQAGGVFSDDARANTRVIDGACIFLNRPGFAGGTGCALHLAAVAAGESPIDWKPSVCWQLPIRVDWVQVDDTHEQATVRAWSRADWGDEGDTMAWCCTEAPDAYVGERPVIDSLGEELEAIVGSAVYVQLRERILRP